MLAAKVSRATAPASGGDGRIGGTPQLARQTAPAITAMKFRNSPAVAMASAIPFVAHGEEIAQMAEPALKPGHRQTRALLSRIEAFERGEIVRVLNDDGLTMAEAAAELGMSRATLYRKIAQYNIHVPRERR